MNEKIEFYSAKDIVGNIYINLTKDNINDKMAFSTIEGVGVLTTNNDVKDKELLDYVNTLFWEFVNNPEYVEQVTDSNIEPLIEIAKRNANLHREQVKQILDVAEADNKIISPISLDLFDDKTIEEIKKMAEEEARIIISKESVNNNPVDPNTGQLITDKIPEYANVVFWKFVNDEEDDIKSDNASLQKIIDIAKSNADSYKPIVENLKNINVEVPSIDDATPSSDVEDTYVQEETSSIEGYVEIGKNDFLKELKQELFTYNFNTSFSATENLVNILYRIDREFNKDKYIEDILIPEVKRDIIEMDNE